LQSSFVILHGLARRASDDLLGALSPVPVFRFGQLRRRQPEYGTVAAHVERLRLILQHAVDGDHEHADVRGSLASNHALRAALATLHDVYLAAGRNSHHPVTLQRTAHVVDPLHQLLHDRCLFLDAVPICLVHDEHERLVEPQQVPDRLALGAREIAIADEQYDVSALRFLERNLVESLFVPAGARHIGKEDLAPRVAVPAVMTHVAGRATDNIDFDISLGYQRLDQGTLPGTDLAEEAKMDDARLLPRSEFLKLALRFADVDTGRLGIAQPFFDLRASQRCPRGRFRFRDRPAPYEQQPDEVDRQRDETDHRPHVAPAQQLRAFEKPVPDVQRGLREEQQRPDRHQKHHDDQQPEHDTDEFIQLH
jgi:hypothetical protein